MRIILLLAVFASIVVSSYAQWTTNGSNIYNSNSGNVGVGTTFPAEKLHVNGSIRGNQSGALRISSGNGYIDIGPKNPDYGHFYTDRPYGFYFNSDLTIRTGTITSYHTEDFDFATQSISTFQPIVRMTIKRSNGYVGIGTTSPAYMLDVNGPINATALYVNGAPFSGGGGNTLWTTSYSPYNVSLLHRKRILFDWHSACHNRSSDGRV